MTIRHNNIISTLHFEEVRPTPYEIREAYLRNGDEPPRDSSPMGFAVMIACSVGGWVIIGALAMAVLRSGVL
jgi:hypothetical protein